jgi:phosphoserine/homoserine phosphotransferase
MYITCLDLEGVLVPEIWIAFSEATGIPELALTTRDVPDYDVLMRRRIDILAEHHLRLADVQRTIALIDPLDGAKDFLDSVRETCQVVILSDTFTQFAFPLMKKLGMPTIFCNELHVSDGGDITGYTLRQQNGKYHAVKAFKSMGFKTIASGDSFNDLAMIHEADTGFLFRAPARILSENPTVPAFSTYDELLTAIQRIV